MALSPADERSDQPVSAADGDHFDPSDTTSILHGAAAITGKASWSAMRVAQANEALSLYEADRKLRLAHEEQEARELAHLAEWNTQMTVVGGVQMTNAEAQTSRRRVLANADFYADRAIANGEIEETDRENFKRWMARKIDLEDKRGRGTITEAEAEEEADGDRTRVGHAADLATGRDHQVCGVALSVANADATANVSLRSNSDRPLDDYAMFQVKGVGTPKLVSESPSSLPSAKVQATGLNL